MNKQELIELFTHCGENASLFEAAQEAVRRLTAFSAVRVVIGDRQPCDELFRIYNARLRRNNERDIQVRGLVETVQAFSTCQGQLRGGYIETDAGLIYFWVNEAESLVGCIVQDL